MESRKSSNKRMKGDDRSRIGGRRDQRCERREGMGEIGYVRDVGFKL